jgi:hypothetical protein
MPIKSVYIFRIFVLTLFLVSFKVTFSQSGNIRIYIDQVEYNDSIPFEARLYSSDSLLIYKCNIYEVGSVKIDSIIPGNYYLDVYRAGLQQLTIHHLIVKKDSITDLVIDFSSITHRYTLLLNGNKKSVDVSSGVPNFAFTFQTYQPGFSSQKEIVNSIYDFGVKFTPLYYPSKYYGIGANLGSNIGFCKLQKDKVKLFTDTFNVEKYFCWKIFAGINNRFVFVQPKVHKLMRPCFLDLGIGYNFPFIYRYAGVNRDYKRVKGFISNLNDFSVTTRLGFGILAFTASYRITNDLKKAYYNVPRLMFGIDLIIPHD